MNLPIALTLLRIFLVPLLVVVLLTRTETGVLFGVGIFGLAVLTDYLDGYFARRRNQVTRVGILLDPLADKLLITAAYISLVELGSAPAWMVMIILGREFAVTGLRNIAAGRGILIAASPLGKGKMVLQVISIFLLLLGRSFPVLDPFGIVALWLAVVVAIVSGVQYAYRFRRDVARAARPAEPISGAFGDAGRDEAGLETRQGSQRRVG
ncbi:MAG: CDP-diacylglycerol--glycerol-3-phosphate 3-phosphatidyltransferase [Vicinamibacteria bacterium]